ncbi:hypothetical protein P9112_002305 [Eukaryota sp. TZLM1-RC]
MSVDTPFDAANAISLMEFRSNKKLSNFFSSDSAIKRLKSLLQYLEVSHEFEQRALYSTQYAQVYSCFLDAIKAYDARNKTLSASELISCCGVVKRLLQFLPNIIKTKWQYKSLVYLVKCLLVHTNKHSVRMLGVELLLHLVDALSSSADDSLLELIPGLIVWTPFFANASLAPLISVPEYNGVLVGSKSSGATVADGVEILSFILAFVDFKDIRRFVFYYDLLKVHLFPLLFPNGTKSMDIALDSTFEGFDSCPSELLLPLSERLITWINKSYHRVVICRDAIHLNLLLDIFSQGVCLPDVAVNLVSLYGDWLLRGATFPKCYSHKSITYDCRLISQLVCIFESPSGENSDSAVIKVLSLLKELVFTRELSQETWMTLLDCLVKMSKALGPSRVHSRRMFDVLFGLFSSSGCDDVALWRSLVKSCESFVTFSSEGNVFMERWEKFILNITNLIVVNARLDQSDHVISQHFEPSFDPSTPLPSFPRETVEGLGDDECPEFDMADQIDVQSGQNVTSSDSDDDVTTIKAIPIENLQLDFLVFVWSQLLHCFPHYYDRKEEISVVNNCVSAYCQGLEVLNHMVDVLSNICLKKSVSQGQDQSRLVLPCRNHLLTLFGPFIMTSIGICKDFFEGPFELSNLVEGVNDNIVSVGVKLICKILVSCDDSMIHSSKFSNILVFFSSFLQSLLTSNISTSGISVLVNLLPIYNGFIGEEIHNNTDEVQMIHASLFSTLPSVLNYACACLGDVKTCQNLIESAVKINQSFPSIKNVIYACLRHSEASLTFIITNSDKFSNIADLLTSSFQNFQHFLTRNDSLSSSELVIGARVLVSLYFGLLKFQKDFIPSNLPKIESLLADIAKFLTDLLLNLTGDLVAAQVVSIIDLMACDIDPSTLTESSLSALAIIFDGLCDLITIIVCRFAPSESSKTTVEAVSIIFSTLRTIALRSPDLIQKNLKTLNKFIGTVELVYHGETTLLNIPSILKLNRKLKSSPPKSFGVKSFLNLPNNQACEVAVLNLQLLLALLNSFPFADGYSFIDSNCEEVLDNSCTRYLFFSSNSIVTLSESATASRITVRNSVGKFSFDLESISNVDELDAELAETKPVQPTCSGNKGNNPSKSVVESQDSDSTPAVDLLDDPFSKYSSCTDFVNIISNALPDVTTIKSQAEKVIKSALNSRVSDDSPSSVDEEKELRLWEQLVNPLAGELGEQVPDKLKYTRLLLGSLGLVHPIAASSTRVQSVNNCDLFQSELRRLDGVSGRDFFDVSVIFCQSHQRKIEDFITNSDVSSGFLDFVNGLGWSVDSKFIQSSQLFEHLPTVDCFLNDKVLYFANEFSELLFCVFPSLKMENADKLKLSRMSPVQIIYSDSNSVLHYLFSSSSVLHSPITRLSIVVTPTFDPNMFRVNCFPSSSSPELSLALPSAVVLPANKVPAYTRSLAFIGSKMVSKAFNSGGLSSRHALIKDLISRFGKEVDSVKVLCDVFASH